MKSIIFSLLIFVSVNVCAQYTELKDIKIINGAVVYQRVFESTGDIASKVSRILKAGPFTEVTENSAYLSDFSINPVKYSSYKQSPIYMRGKWYGNVVVDLKEGKYRITITSIQVLVPLEFNYGGVDNVATKESIEKYFVKKDLTFKSAQEQSVVLLCDALSDLFREVEQTTDNW